MPAVEVYDEKDDSHPLFVADLAFLPRLGEHLSQDAGGYFRYLFVTKVWHRQSFDDGLWHTCVLVKVDD